MSIATIKNALENLKTCTTWSLQLLNIKVSQRNGIDYRSRQITLAPAGRLAELLDDISSIYLDTDKNSKNKLAQYRGVLTYDGTADAMTMYKLSTTSDLIAEAYSKLTQVIAGPDTESDPFEYKSAYILKGEIIVGGETKPIKLVSMQCPITTLKNKFSLHNGTFQALTQQVIYLRSTIDVIILDNTVYFLTLSGEKLFDMERSYKTACRTRLEVVEQAGIIHGIEQFKAIAGSGHNPRRFIAFNPSRLEALKRKSKRQEIAKQFSIPLDASGSKFDATIEGASEKIVKLLCDKGMTDPFKNVPVEVDGARKWQ